MIDTVLLMPGVCVVGVGGGGGRGMWGGFLGNLIYGLD